MKIRIYQVDFDKETAREYAFGSYDQIVKQTGEENINKAAYKEVYECELPDDVSLDDIYYIFNMQRPEDFEGHSLSVSDIVETPKGLFFCDSFGWKVVFWR